MSMTNFTGADMPGSEAYAKAHGAAKPAKAEKKEAAPKEKKAAKKEVKDSSETTSEALPEAPEQTDTETHGVGPSTVEGAEVSDETKEALAESVGVETPEED